MVLLLGMISMDVRSLVDTDTTLTLFDNLFVPVSCATCMSNISAMKTGVHWGKWYSFWQCLVIPHMCNALVTVNRHHAWVSFEATAEVFNHATSNENASHFGQYLNTHLLQKLEAEEGMLLCIFLLL